ncbi:MAG TPA: hypothetical protein VJX67_06310 [Blastocatellia bacterium]|nr:hypothetical protein [Blastocatellia bacterium]
MKGEVTLEDGTYGPRAVLNSGWSDSVIDYLTNNGVVELELNQAKGWRGGDLSFLSEFPALKSFKIFDFNIKDITPIHFLHDLRELGVTTYCLTEIDFSAFPRLDTCGLEWGRRKASSISDCTTLKKLMVSCYKGKDVDPFARLINLESLAILVAPVGNLHGLNALRNLRRLRLGRLTRLTSLAGIEGLADMEELNVDTCRAISNIEQVASLLRLRKLFVDNCGEIDSLKPMEKLSNLEMVGFVESTNILDGDLSPLIGLRNLSRLAFQNRRHYSHRREEFRAFTG